MFGALAFLGRPAGGAAAAAAGGSVACCTAGSAAGSACTSGAIGSVAAPAGTLCDRFLGGMSNTFRVAAAPGF